MSSKTREEIENSQRWKFYAYIACICAFFSRRLHLASSLPSCRQDLSAHYLVSNIGSRDVYVLKRETSLQLSMQSPKMPSKDIFFFHHKAKQKARKIRSAVALARVRFQTPGNFQAEESSTQPDSNLRGAVLIYMRITSPAQRQRRNW